MKRRDFFGWSLIVSTGIVVRPHFGPPPTVPPGPNSSVLPGPIMIEAYLNGKKFDEALWESDRPSYYFTAPRSGTVTFRARVVGRKPIKIDVIPAPMRIVAGQVAGLHDVAFDATLTTL